MPSPRLSPDMCAEVVDITCRPCAAQDRSCRTCPEKKRAAVRTGVFTLLAWSIEEAPSVESDGGLCGSFKGGREKGEDEKCCGQPQHGEGCGALRR